VFIGKGLWIPAKAYLAQMLIQDSWQQHQQTGKPDKPWPWADTYPIAELNFMRGKRQIVVLNGGDPTTLAFSVGAIAPFNQPIVNQPFVVAGHRDSHFSFLEEVVMKDIISLTDKHGRNRLYQVEAIDIVDASKGDLPLLPNSGELVLITCYPFKGLSENSDERFVITARPLD
jgi:sortase A